MREWKIFSKDKIFRFQQKMRKELLNEEERYYYSIQFLLIGHRPPGHAGEMANPPTTLTCDQAFFSFSRGERERGEREREEGLIASYLLYLYLRTRND